MTPMDTGNEFDRRLTSALEHPPAVHIPADFAARVAREASAMPLRRSRRAVSYSRIFTSAAAALLLLAMFVIAPWARPGFRSIAFDVELVLLVQLILVSGWLAHARAWL